MKVEIYDMDGTIVDSSHRYRTIIGDDGRERIDLAFWRENEHRAMEDGLLPMAAQYMESLRDPSKFVIIATARIMSAPDWQFVNQILGKPKHLISRRLGDTQSGKTLKIKGLQRFFNLKQFRAADAVFFEDNIEYLKAVCDHFQIRGVYVPSKQGH